MLFVLNPHRFWFPTFLTWLNFVVVILLDVQPNLSTIFSRIFLKHVVEGFYHSFNPIGSGPFFQCLFDIIVIIQQMCWYKIRIITYLSNNNRYTIFIYLHLLIGSVYGSVSTYVCPYQRDLSVHVMCSQISHVSVVSVQAPLQLAMSWHHVIIPHIWNFVEDRGMWIRVDFGVDHHDHDWLAQNWAIWNFVVPCKNLFHRRWSSIM